MASCSHVREWSTRSAAVANLLNPAVMSLITVTCAIEYERKGAEPLPFTYAFLVAPLVLHKDTREALPIRVDSHMSRWVSSHEVIAAGFGARAKSLVPAVREGIRFGLRTGALTIADGCLTGYMAKRGPAKTGDIKALVAKSAFVGRWFAQAESPTTTLALLGVTP